MPTATFNLNAVDIPEFLPFEIALDSGAVDHVADSVEAPGYTVDANSKSTQRFAAANGDPIDNRGEMILNLTTTAGHPIQSKFQVCDVSRPLWSVSKVCDSGCTVTFDSKGATVKHVATGKDLCVFERKQGLYVASLPLAKPGGSASPGFQRQD